jgi:glycosyltransferase involved in cell wall biosynthesis
MNEELKFSIIIPTYNEENDIERTLDSLMKIKYSNIEILVIDDSVDNTANIVRMYKDNGVDLIIPKERKGRSEARNIGIRASCGDILMILNADVLLTNSCFQKIKKHYEDGYDSVCVMNLVENLDSVYSRYIGMHNYRKKQKGVFLERQKNLKGIWWTEGFSARRSFIMKTSLFPTSDVVPIVAGEDVRFVNELRELGCKGIFDEKIVITHIAPSTFKEYWSIRKGRGEGTPQIRILADGWSIDKVRNKALLKLLKRTVMFFFIIPVAIHCYHLAKFSKKNTFVETIKFTYAWVIEQAAMTIGEFSSLAKLKNKLT